VETHLIGPADGLRVELLAYGATVHRLLVPTPTGLRNVVLGHRTREEYVAGTAFLGATVGRFANRIARGRFDLDGSTYALAVNENGSTLHGGPAGFDTRDWTLAALDRDSATFTLVSPDGDQGFPGTVRASVTYTVQGTVEGTVQGAAVDVELTATTDAPTPVSLTQHAYFQLDGEGAGSVDDHTLAVHADAYTPTDERLVPTGELAAVDGTPFDLRAATRLGDAVRTGHPQLLAARGIDHNLVLRGTGMREAATLRTRDLALTLSTDAPGLQVYTGNFLDGTVVGPAGRAYRQGDGVALEPQAFPDTPNRPAFGDATLRPGETYRRRVRWAFDAG
jgi:aldose 1-epimerase